MAKITASYHSNTKGILQNDESKRGSIFTGSLTITETEKQKNGLALARGQFMLQTIVAFQISRFAEVGLHCCRSRFLEFVSVSKIKATNLHLLNENEALNSDSIIQTDFVL